MVLFSPSLLQPNPMILSATDGEKIHLATPADCIPLFTQSSIPMYEPRVCQIQGLDVGNKKLVSSN